MSYPKLIPSVESVPFANEVIFYELADIDDKAGEVVEIVDNESAWFLFKAKAVSVYSLFGNY